MANEATTGTEETEETKSARFRRVRFVEERSKELTNGRDAELGSNSVHLVLHERSEKLAFHRERKREKVEGTNDVRRARTERRASTSKNGREIGSLELVDVNDCIEDASKATTT